MAPNDKKGNRRRPSRTAAVTIKGTQSDFSYAEALKTLRSNIALPDLDIQSKVRKAAVGGLIIKISANNKAGKAERLKNKISEVLGSSVKVARPVIKGEMRLIGLDDSVITEEVADTIAVAGGYLAQEVRVGAIRPMSNGLFTVWAQCPLGAAIKATQSGKIKIGCKDRTIKIKTGPMLQVLGQRPLKSSMSLSSRQKQCLL